MGKRKPKVGIGIRLSEAVMLKLERLCKQEGLTKAEIIRAGVDREIHVMERRRKHYATQ